MAQGGLGAVECRCLSQAREPHLRVPLATVLSLKSISSSRLRQTLQQISPLRGHFFESSPFSELPIERKDRRKEVKGKKEDQMHYQRNEMMTKEGPRSPSSRALDSTACLPQMGERRDLEGYEWQERRLSIHLVGRGRVGKSLGGPPGNTAQKQFLIFHSNLGKMSGLDKAHPDFNNTAIRSQ